MSDSHDEEAGEEAVRLHVQQMAAVLLDGELPAQPLGRDGAGDDGRQGQAASQTRLGQFSVYPPRLLLEVGGTST